MSIGGLLIREANEFLDKSAMEKIQAFNEPSFAEGSSGTLHGKRTDANGYKFIQFTLFGSPTIKTVKGCSLTFESPEGTISCHSDTKDIESIYSETLGKGITTFEIYLDDTLFEELKKPVNSVKITFPRRLFGKDSFSFEISSKEFLRLVR